MTSMSRVNVPLRLVATPSTPIAPFVCFRCRIQIANTSRDALHSQRRTLRTRLREQSALLRSPQTSPKRQLDGVDKQTPENRSTQYSPNGQSSVGDEDRATDARPIAKRKAAVLDQDDKLIAQDDEEKEDNEEVDEEEYDEEDNDVEQTTDYVPATTWHGLKTLKPSEWDGQARYEGFNSESGTQEHTDVEWAIHCALVEFYTLKQHGHPIDYMYNSPKSLMRNLLPTKATTFERGADGGFRLRFLDEQKEQAIIRSLIPSKPVEIRIIEEEPPPEDTDDRIVEPMEFLEDEPDPGAPIAEISTSGKSAEQAFMKFTPPDRSWLEVPLTDPSLKFAILKRTSQLLGLRIPDPQAVFIQDTSNLLAMLTKKPKPKRLAHQLKNDTRLEGLKNLQMYPRRWTADRKDEEVGRAKVIAKEMSKRGIPPSGQSRRPRETLAEREV